MNYKQNQPNDKCYELHVEKNQLIYRFVKIVGSFSTSINEKNNYIDVILCVDRCLTNYLILFLK